MRVLVDSSFTRSAEGPIGDHLIVRYADTPVSDAQLLHHAVNRHFDVVVFLGRRAAAEPSLRQLLSEVGEPQVAFTVTEDPTEAGLYLRLRLGDLAEVVRTTRGATWLIRKDGVDKLPLPIVPTK
jgi:hypothetical protein